MYAYRFNVTVQEYSDSTFTKFSHGKFFGNDVHYGKLVNSPEMFLKNSRKVLM